MRGGVLLNKGCIFIHTWSVTSNAFQTISKSLTDFIPTSQNKIIGVFMQLLAASVILVIFFMEVIKLELDCLKWIFF